MYLTIAVTFRVYCLPRPFIKRCFMKMYSLVCVYVWWGGGGGGWEGGWSKTFCTGRLRREVQPLTLL